MKKILSLFTSFILVLSSVQSAYALGSSDNVQKKEVLNALGIMSMDKEGEFVTREEFFGGLLHMFYDDEEIYSVSKQSVLTGFVESVSDDVFSAETYVSYNDAITAAVTALGYEAQAKLNGGYPKGFVSVAGYLGLLKGVNGSRTLSLSRESITNLYYNMLNVEPYAVPYDTNGITYEIMKDDTILSMQRDIYEISGLVTANEKTALISPDGNAEKQITIDGENYYIGDTNAGELLGMYVEGFVKKESDTEDGTVVFLRPKENRTSVLEIVDEDIISVSPACDSIRYDDANREKTAKISKTVRVIYNGRFYDGYTADELKPEMGKIRLVDNDGDRTYDCLFVTSYEVMTVDYVNYDEYEIFGSYKYSDALNYIKFEDKENNPGIHYFLDGEEVDIKAIGKYDILTIERSKDSELPLVNVYISRNNIIGSYQSFNRTENFITLNDTVYPVASVFYKEFPDGEIKIGETYCFYIDYFGSLVYAKKSVSTDYALFYKAYEDEDNDSTYKIVYLNDSSEWITTTLAKNVRFNGVTTSEKTVFNELKLLDPQVMLIRANAAGEVNSITVAEIGKKGEKLLAKTADQRMRYRSTPRTFDCNLYMESGAKIFVIPQEKTNDRDEYYVTSSYFVGDRYYTVAAYDVDEYNFSHVFSVSVNADTSKSGVGNGFFIVTEIIERMNDDGDVVPVITGSMGRYINLEYEAKNADTFDGLEKGSIIRIHTDKNKKVDYWETVTPSTITELWNSLFVIDGTVLMSDYAGGKLKLDRNGGTYLRHNNSAVILIYDSEEKECVMGSPKDIVPGDYLIMNIEYAMPQEIIVIR